MMTILSNSVSATEPTTISDMSCKDLVTLHETDDEGNRDQLVYRHKFGTVELHSESLKCLQAGTYLSDKIIEFYSAFCWNLCPDSLAKRIHIFDTIFFGELVKVFDNKTKNDKREVDISRWKQLPKWYNNVNLFEKDFLIFPVCRDDHWMVIVVCYPNNVKPTFVKQDTPQPSILTSTPISKTKEISKTAPKPTSSQAEDNKLQGKNEDNIEEEIFHIAREDIMSPPPRKKPRNNIRLPGILVMDSLGGKNHSNITMIIRDFLLFDWRQKKGAPIKRFSHHDLDDYFPSLPKQTNAFDCGMYLCIYMKCFLSDPYEFYRLVRRNDTESRSSLKTKILDYLNEGGRDELKKLILKVCESHVA